MGQRDLIDEVQKLKLMHDQGDGYITKKLLKNEHIPFTYWTLKLVDIMM